MNVFMVFFHADYLQIQFAARSTATHLTNVDNAPRSWGS